jgi:hypothetical protein
MSVASGASGAVSGAGAGMAIGGPIGAGVGGLVGFLGGLFGGGDDSGKEYVDKAIQELIKVHVPDPEQQKIALQRYQSTGQIEPSLEQAITANPTALEGVVKNTQYAQAQNKALSQLQDIGESGGMRLSDKADLQEQLIQNANKDRANRDAITDEAARRGQLGSGMALQAQLQGAQAAGDRDAQARLHTLGGAQDRALQAIMGAGDLAGKLDSEDYKRQSDLAEARDRINQFNVTNAQGVRQRNVAAQNAAAAENLEGRQKIANSNTDLFNKEETYNKGLGQQNFDNQMQKAGAMASAYTGGANQADKSQARSDQMWGGAISGAGQLASGVREQNRWDDFMKKWKGTPA